MLDYLFDHLGLLVWVFLLVLSIIDLTNKKLSKWPRIVLLCIAIAGIVLDLTLLVMFYVNIAGGFWFDFLGLPVFAFITWVGLSDINNRKLKHQVFVRWILFSLGILGLAADLFVLMYTLM